MKLFFLHPLKPRASPQAADEELGGAGWQGSHMEDGWAAIFTAPKNVAKNNTFSKSNPASPVQLIRLFALTSNIIVFLQKQ